MRWKDYLTYTDLVGKRRLRPYVRIGLAIAVLVFAGMTAFSFIAASGNEPHPVVTPEVVAVQPTPTPASQKTFKQVVKEVSIWKMSTDGQRIHLASPNGWYTFDMEGGKLDVLAPKTTPPFTPPVNIWYVLPTATVNYVSLTHWQPIPTDGYPIYDGDSVDAEPLGQTGQWDGVEWTAVLEQGAWEMTTYQGTPFAITNDGVFNLETADRLGPPLFGNDSILDIGYSLSADENLLLAGTAAGVWTWDGEVWTLGLETSGKRVLDLYIDNETGYWAAVSRDGIYHSPDGYQWQRVLVFDNAQSIAVWDGRLWIGEQNGLLAWSLTPGENGFSAGAPSRVLPYPVTDLLVGGRLYIATTNGLYLYGG